MFGQEIGDLLPLFLREVAELHGEKAFVVDALRHRNPVSDRSSGL